VAIAGINLVQLDHYLMKPWDPPAERLYPVLDDLLSDWSASFRPPFEGIRVAGSLWSPRSHDVKDFLSRSQTPYQWLDVERDAGARAEVEAVSPGLRRLPVVFFPDGTSLVEPGTRALAEKIRLQTTAALPFYDLLIGVGRPGSLPRCMPDQRDCARSCASARRRAGRPARARRSRTTWDFPTACRAPILPVGRPRKPGASARRF
jgi:thioredoxin reductase (NADPH)